MATVICIEEMALRDYRSNGAMLNDWVPADAGLGTPGSLNPDSVTLGLDDLPAPIVATRADVMPQVNLACRRLERQ